MELKKMWERWNSPPKPTKDKKIRRLFEEGEELYDWRIDELVVQIKAMIKKAKESE